MNQNLSTLSYRNTGTVFADNDHILLFPNGVMEGHFSATLTGTPANGDTVTIGAVVYTFRTALTTPPVANEVLVGGSAQASLLNLRDAVNGVIARQGTTYSLLTEANPSGHFPYAPSATVIRLYSRAIGDAVTLAESGGALAWSPATPAAATTEVWVGACEISHITVGAMNDAPINITIYEPVANATSVPVHGGASVALDRWKILTGVTNTATKGTHFDPATAVSNNADVEAAFGAALAGMRVAFGPMKSNEFVAGGAAISRSVVLPIDQVFMAGAIVAITFTDAYTPTPNDVFSVQVHYRPLSGGGGRARRGDRLTHVEVSV